MEATSQLLGQRPAENQHAPEPIPPPERAHTDLAQMMSGMPDDPATANEIAGLEALLRQGRAVGQGPSEMHPPAAREMPKMRQQDKSLLGALKALFNYLTLNAFKKR